EVGPLDQLHREEALLAGHVEIVEPGQVGMREIAQRAELLLEQIELLGTAPREEPLQRDLGEQLLVPCAMDRAHCTRAEMRAELIAPCAERHRPRLVPSHGRGRTREGDRWQEAWTVKRGGQLASTPCRLVVGAEGRKPSQRIRAKVLLGTMTHGQHVESLRCHPSVAKLGTSI